MRRTFLTKSLVATVFGTGCALAMTITEASASIVSFTSASAWQAAVQSPSTVDFNSFTSNVLPNFGQSYTEGGVNFSTTSPVVMFGVPGTNQFPAGLLYGSGYLEWQGGPPATLTITLPSAVKAIGFDFAELFANLGGTDTFTIVVDGSTFTEDTSHTSALFFGVTDTNTFSSFTITDLNGTLGTNNVFPTIDNVSYATTLAPTTAVPEPGSLALFGSALAGLAVIRRRRQERRRAVVR